MFSLSFYHIIILLVLNMGTLTEYYIVQLICLDLLAVLDRYSQGKKMWTCYRSEKKKW